MKHASLILLAVMLSFSCMGQNIDNSPVRSLTLNRYLGKWYEVARMDHRFERGLSHAQAYYYMMDDGTIMVLNSGIKKGKTKTSKGKAKLTGTTGLLRVSFFWPFYSDYRVLMVDENYQFALVGSKTDDYLWILSRTPNMKGYHLDDVLDEARRRGYNTDKLIWVEQSEYHDF